LEHGGLTISDGHSRDAQTTDPRPPGDLPIPPPQSNIVHWPWRRIALNAMIVAAGLFLYLGITQPIIQLTQFYVFSDAHSLASAVYALYLDGEYMLSGIVLVFSILLPTVKLCYLFVLAALPAEQLRAQGRTMRRLEAIGKWSMHDVLILSITIVYLKSSGISDATSQPGARFFALSVLLIMFSYGWIKRSAHDAVEGQSAEWDAAAIDGDMNFSSTRRLTVTLLTTAAAVCLVLGLYLPTIKLTKLYVWTDEHSVFSAIYALYSDGEVFLAAIIGLFSVAIPALKLVYLIVISNLSTARPQRRENVFRRLEWLGKWSMMDVLVLALIIFYVNASSLAEASALAGIYFFTISVFLTMIAYALVKGGVVRKGR